VSRIVFDTDSDPGMQVVSLDDRLSFSNSDDWMGDTESGFGAIVDIELSRNQVAVLRDSLTEWLGDGPPKS
jgi:hypothetical protein